jgi:hypothetical protein
MSCILPSTFILYQVPRPPCHHPSASWPQDGAYTGNLQLAFMHAFASVFRLTGMHSYLYKENNGY